MVPRLVTVLDHAVSDPAALLARVPRERRFRLVLAWPGAAAEASLPLVRAARAGGFTRVRLRARELSEVPLARAIDAGIDEVEVVLPGTAPFGALAAWRAAGRLRFLTVTGSEGTVGENTCGADEVVMRARSATPGPVPADFRLVAVRGAPLCLVPGLDPSRVVANAWTASGPGPSLDLSAEDPGRAYFSPCPRCTLFLACDGIPASSLAGGDGRAVTLRAFGTGEAEEVRLSPGSLLGRIHPPTVLTGRVHLAAVVSGVRPCGRVVVAPSRVSAQVGLLRRLGLHVAVLSPGEVPRDLDRGYGGVEQTAHVFFARDEATALEAASLERAFATGHGSGAMQADEFARRMGRVLGYPGCCVDAFVAAGPLASTADLLRAAHARSRAFAWELNCLDPLSPVTLIPHVPCSFDCEPSIRMARRVLGLLPRVYPFLDGAARDLLSRRALLFPDGGIVTGRGADADSPSLRPGTTPPESVREALPGLARLGLEAFARGHVPTSPAGALVFRFDAVGT